MATNETLRTTLDDVDSALHGLIEWHRRSARRWATGGGDRHERDREQRRIIVIERERMVTDLELIQRLLKEARDTLLKEARDAW